MRKLLYSLLMLSAGLLGGLFAAQGLIVLAGRTGGNFGGEVFTVLAIPFLLLAGFALGKENRHEVDYERAFRDGYIKGLKTEKVERSGRNENEQCLF